MPHVVVAPEGSIAPGPRSPCIVTPSIVAEPCNSSDRSGALTKRWQYLVSRSIIANNTGLLLVAASQFFFSLMNLAVKKLNSVDPPVPALEVFIFFHHPSCEIGHDILDIS